MRAGERAGGALPGAPSDASARWAQVDGFPPKEVVKTVFVEHDIQGDLGELNLVDYVQVISPSLLP